MAQDSDAARSRSSSRRSTAAQSLKLPQNPQVFGNAMPSVIKATAIVNGDVITQTDIDQRLRCWRSPTAARSRPRSWSGLREQVLRNLIDETLEIQAAKDEKIDDQAVGHRQDARSASRRT